MLLGVYFGLFLAIELFGQSVWANNASWPRPGPSWLSEDDQNVKEPEPRQNTPYKAKISFTNQNVKDAFAIFTCDEAVEMQMSPLVVRRKTKAFKELKKTLQQIINLPLTDIEVERRIRYYNTYVLKREPRCRINWLVPEARAALLRYQTEMEIERILLPGDLQKSDIIDSMPFQELKRSIENIFGYTFNNDNFYNRASMELINMRHSFARPFSKPTHPCGLESITDSFQTPATSCAQDSASSQISPAMSALMLIDWSHPEVASAFRVFQLELPRELPLSQNYKTIIASAAFQKLKKAVERIYNCRLANNLFYDFVMARLCSM